MHRTCRDSSADFDAVVDFLEDTQGVTLARPVPLLVVIGGHCPIPSIQLGLKSYGSEFLRLALKSNESEEEIRDENIISEVERVKKRASDLKNH